MREIRHRFCWLLPAKALDRIVQEVGYDLEYVRDSKEKKRHKDELDRVQKKLHALAHKSEPNEEELGKCRVALAALSVAGGNVREAHWHKLNLLRARLTTTAILLFCLSAGLVIGLFDWPVRFRLDQTSKTILGVVGFGAIGGLLSSLRQQEPLVGTSAVFYTERALLYLRPVVGAVAALVLYFAQLSGLVTFGLKQEPATFYFVAFCAGFSEQFFLKRLSSFLGEGKSKKKKSKEADE